MATMASQYFPGLPEASRSMPELQVGSFRVRVPFVAELFVAVLTLQPPCKSLEFLSFSRGCFHSPVPFH